MKSAVAVLHTQTHTHIQRDTHLATRKPHIHNSTRTLSDTRTLSNTHNKQHTHTHKATQTHDTHYTHDTQSLFHATGVVTEVKVTDMQHRADLWALLRTYIPVFVETQWQNVMVTATHLHICHLHIFTTHTNTYRHTHMHTLPQDLEFLGYYVRDVLPLIFMFFREYVIHKCYAHIMQATIPLLWQAW